MSGDYSERARRRQMEAMAFSVSAGFAALVIGLALCGLGHAARWFIPVAIAFLVTSFYYRETDGDGS